MGNIVYAFTARQKSKQNLTKKLQEMTDSAYADSEFAVIMDAIKDAVKNGQCICTAKISNQDHLKVLEYLGYHIEHDVVDNQWVISWD